MKPLSRDVFDLYKNLYEKMIDFEFGWIRHNDNNFFAEDPLRVLDVCQLAASLNMHIAPETIQLCSEVDLSVLSKEEVYEEVKEVLLKSNRPQIFFQNLQLMDQLDLWFPELKELIGCVQEPAHHPEGDAWNHTMLVIDFAAKLRKSSSNPEFFMMAALCHDLGKPATTCFDGEKIRAIGHDTEGVNIAENFIIRLTDNKDMLTYVKNMVELHMAPNKYAKAGDVSHKVTNKLFDRSVCPDDLLLLAKADHYGRGHSISYAVNENFLQERLSWFQQYRKSNKEVSSADLVEAGLEPGLQFEKAIELAHKLWLADVPYKNANSQVLGSVGLNRKQEESKDEYEY